MDPRVCETLLSREAFPEYINRLRNATNNDFSLISNCTLNICGALWGTGNPDISGIGMAIGYLMQTLVGAIIVAASLWCHAAKSNATPASHLLISTASRSYYDTTSFFTFAIQIACIVTLSRADWGYGTDGMGGTTKEITWLVSSVTLLPLLPFILRPRLFRGKSMTTSYTHTAQSSMASAVSNIPTSSDKLIAARQDHRLYTLVICWALAFASFYSRMGNTFGQSMIGDSKEAVITTNDWEKIEQACLAKVHTLSPALTNLITSVGMMSYLLATFIVLLKIYVSATEGQGQRKQISKKIHDLNTLFDEQSVHGLVAWLSVCALVAFLLAVQFWAFFRLRQIQSDMVTSAQGSSPDGEWSFGQIVAIVVFIPVLAEVLFVQRKLSLYVNASE